MTRGSGHKITIPCPCQALIDWERWWRWLAKSGMRQELPAGKRRGRPRKIRDREFELELLRRVEQVLVHLRDLRDRGRRLQHQATWPRWMREAFEKPFEKRAPKLFTCSEKDWNRRRRAARETIAGSITGWGASKTRRSVRRPKPHQLGHLVHPARTFRYGNRVYHLPAAEIDQGWWRVLPAEPEKIGAP